MRIGMVCSLIFGGCITSAVIAQTPTPSNNSSAPTINVTVDSPGSNPPTSEPQPSDPTASPIHALADNDTPNRVWFNAEYVLWFIRGQSVHPCFRVFQATPQGQAFRPRKRPRRCFHRMSESTITCSTGLGSKADFGSVPNPVLVWMPAVSFSIRTVTEPHSVRRASAESVWHGLTSMPLPDFRPVLPSPEPTRRIRSAVR